MKRLWQILVDHIRQDARWFPYLWTLIFLSICIYLEYSTGNTWKKLMIRQWGDFSGIATYSLVNYTGYYLVIIPILLYKKSFKILANPSFWIKSFLILTIIGFERGFFWFNKLSEFIKNPDESHYFFAIINNLKGIIFVLTLLSFIKLIFDRKEKGLYGLNSLTTQLKPFFVLILFVVPLVLWASFQQDFQNYYPNFKPWLHENIAGLKPFFSSLYFELAYGIDFLSVELCFRGALVIGMASILGKDAILPMASTYVLIHFGKPLAETISSFFGGYILGVFALNLRHIWGGTIVHIGLAWMMDLAGIIHHLFNRS